MPLYIQTVFSRYVRLSGCGGKGATQTEAETCRLQSYLAKIYHVKLQVQDVQDSSKLWASGLRGNMETEMEKWKVLRADLISDAALAHVFFKSVSAPVQSGTQLPRFPIKVAGSFGLLIHLLEVSQPS